MSKSAALEPTDPVREILVRSKLLQHSDRETANAVVDKLRLFPAECGHVLYREGEPADGLFVILSGSVKISVRMDRRDRLVGLLAPGDAFGEVSALGLGVREATAVVASEALLARLDKGALDGLLERADVALTMVRIVANALRHSRADVADVVFLDARGRVAKHLVQLARHFGVLEGSRVLVQHGLTQTELADLIGVARETVSKTMAEFTRRGWIRVGAGLVEIRDLPRLRHRGQLGDASFRAAETPARNQGRRSAANCSRNPGTKKSMVSR